ncbi:DnaJ domain containing protein, putative [Leishmania donovani]|uniref:DnaJ domain containing protein, putative n=1 Tax=Leishmania donovani TaxID=5661 RepID=A0A3Q8IB40_LEIDO|nr:DnaJ domain containing protein, putative [Leishmania donovani]
MGEKEAVTCVCVCVRFCDSATRVDMLRHCPLHRCLPISVACRVLGFQAPPTSKHDLRKRFVQLTKECHPDLHAENEKAATAKMVQLTEAYTCLKKLLEHRVQYHQGAGLGPRPSSASASGEGSAAARPHEDVWAEVTASFRAPGSSISLRGFTLPWQRTTSNSVISSLEAKMREANVSFSDFVRYARHLEKDRQTKENRIRADAAMADGTHGFTAEYFESVNKNSAFRRATERRRLPMTHFMTLGAFYYGRRLRNGIEQAPRGAWRTLRYVVLGH